MSESVSNRKSAEKPSELLNDLFTSNSVDKILEFYSSFNTVEDLIRWMEERPKGRAEIYEIEGNKDIIVVLPTANFNGEYARLCRDDIFRGLQMVFVESGGKNDSYFNYAHNVNKGIIVAMKSNPKWIVVSNDDMIKIDDVSVLVNELDRIDNEKIDVVYTDFTYGYHSTPVELMTMTGCGLNIYSFSITRSFKLSKLINDYSVPLTFTIADLSGHCLELSFLDRIKTIALRTFPIFLKRTGISFTQMGAFGIFSRNFLSKNGIQLFDETFLSGSEDVDLSFRLLRNRSGAHIDYKIKPMAGGTLDWNVYRTLRSLAGRIYFYAKNTADIQAPPD